MPFRAETIRGYLEAMHQLYLTDPAVKTTVAEARPLIRIELRFKYNQNFESIYTMVPSTMSLMRSRAAFSRSPSVLCSSSPRPRAMACSFRRSPLHRSPRCSAPRILTVLQKRFGGWRVAGGIGGFP
jgi:hypothetical protein